MIPKTSQKLKQYTEKPPEMAWQNIANALEKQKPKSPFSFIRIGTFAAGLALLSLLSIFVYNSFYQNKSDLGNSTQKSPSKDQISEPKGKEEDANTQQGFEESSDAKISQSEKTTKGNPSHDISSDSYSTTSKSTSTNLSNRQNSTQNSSNSAQNRRQNVVTTPESIENNLPQNSNTLLTVASPREEISTPENQISAPEHQNSVSKQPENSVQELELAQHEISSLQDAENKEDKEMKMLTIPMPKWEIRTYFSPTNLISANNESALLPDLETFNNENQDVKHYGISLAYNLKPRLYVRSGMEYLSFNQASQNVNVTTTPESFTNLDSESIAYSGNVKIVSSRQIMQRQLIGLNSNTEPVLERGNVNQEVSYVAIPLEIGYVLHKASVWDLSVNAGFANYILSNNALYFVNDNLQEELGVAQNLNPYSVSSLVGLESNLTLYKGLRMSVQPQFRYFFNTFSNDMKTQPISFGINLGMKYQF